MRRIAGIGFCYSAGADEFSRIGLACFKGDLKGCHAVKVSANWRVIFAFEGKDAILVDYKDCH